VPEPLYVDPELLKKLGDPWSDVGQEWIRLGGQLAMIKARYHGCWGDDDLGKKFGPEYLRAFAAIEEQLAATGETLTYYGDGLVTNGKIFAKARDVADDETGSFLASTEPFGSPEPFSNLTPKAEATVRFGTPEPFTNARLIDDETDPPRKSVHPPA